LQSKYRDQALEVVGVLCDAGTERERRRAAELYQADRELNFEVYVESTSGAVQDLFDVTGYPMVVLLDGRGRKLWSGHPKRAGELEQTIREFVESRTK
jgi:hypothetical protein